MFSKGTMRSGRGASARTLSLSAMILGAALVAGPVLAQDAPPPAVKAPAGKAPAAKPAAPFAKKPTAPAAAGAPTAAGAAPQAPAAAGGAAPGPGAQAKNDASWVKLCERAPQLENKEICLTHHERLDGNTGVVLVAAAVRKVEGQDKQHLLVTIPTAIALAIPPGVQAKIDEGEPMALRYTFCYATSCQAEIEVSNETIDKLKTGTQLVIAAMNMQRKAVGFPVALSGFGKAYDGPAIDSKKYAEARGKLMDVIRKRQAELAKKADEAQNQKTSEKAPAAATTGTAPAQTQRSAAKPVTPASATGGGQARTATD